MEYIESRTFDDIGIGESASLVRTISREDIALFAVASGDYNPAHLDDAYAAGTPFGTVIAHGMWGAAQISALLGTKFPGPGTIYVGQSLQFRRPVLPGDTITVSVTVTEKNEAKKRLILDCRCTNQAGKDVITGVAEVIPPAERGRRPRPALPRVTIDWPGDAGEHEAEA